MSNQRKKNSPYKITTIGTWTRRIIHAIGIVVGVSTIWILLSIITGVLPSPWDYISHINNIMVQEKNKNNNTNKNISNSLTSKEKNKNTVKNANKMISSYYSALAANDTSKLHEIGAGDAATAIEQGWLAKINYCVNKNNQPEAAELPKSVGEYAGNDLYSISDFYSNDSNDAVSSDATGNTGHVGWIYFDSMTETWTVVDPTIPTSIQTPSTTSVSLTSSDNTSSVRLTSIGSLSNAWWAKANINITIKTSSQITSTKTKFDGGITVTYPKNLIGTISGEQTGNVSISRGITDKFSIDRIGQDSLVLNGDMSPCILQTEGQNITPIFVFGNK